MNPLLIATAVSLGITLSATAIAFFQNKRTEKEDNERSDIIKDIEQNRKLREQKINDILSEYDVEKLYQKLKEQSNSEFIKLLKSQDRQRFEAEENEFRILIINICRNTAQNRLDIYTSELIDELKTHIKELGKFKKEHCTPMRLHALELLRQELKTALEKAFAYKVYLSRYIGCIERIYDVCSESIEELLFSYTLPQGFPYDGAIMYFPPEEFDLSGYKRLMFHQVMPVTLRVMDIETLQKSSAAKEIPVYVDKSNVKDNKERYSVVSVQKGIYFSCKRSGGYSGIPAKVDRYDKRNNVILTYGQDMELTLRPQNLRNIGRYPVIGREIDIYPLEEIYSKEENCIIFLVTERIEDTEISFSFDEIPIAIPNEKIVTFCTCLNEKFKEGQITTEFDDAKIAPFNENSIDKLVKLQFNDELIIIARIKQLENNQYFEFEDFAQPDMAIKAGDVFASFNALIKIYSEQELSEALDNNADTINNLILTVFREFEFQQEIKLAQDGGRYFTAWEQVTDRLRDYLLDGNNVTCTIEGLDIYKDKMKNFVLRYQIGNSDILKSFVSRQRNERYLLFFIKKAGLRIMANIEPSCEYVTVTLPKSSGNYDDELKQDLMGIEDITVYCQETPVPEQRQLAALYQFKTGQMANQRLHSFALNSSSVKSQIIEQEELTLKNKNLDDSQKYALITAMGQKDLFMIQGPPGTGKTTVIREIIWQTIKRDPNSRILIVSQANVAVDNVLSGLLEAGLPDSDLLRCGRLDKISEDIHQVSYEYKFKNYLKCLEKNVERGDKLAEQWLDILNHSFQRNADISDLLIRSHRIIGATCVGLAQRNIGLEETKFDLVIIDEAGKALAPEILIPLNKARKAIIIGDHHQLPPVVHPALYDPEKIELDDREYLKKEIFESSFFERLFENCPDSNKTILTTQYRMPAIIGNMISEIFYNGKIKCAENTNLKHPIFFDSPINMIDMSNIREYIEDDSNGSPQNSYEARFVFALINVIRKKSLNTKIAVITPYKGQKRKIIDTFLKNGFDRSLNGIAVDTVDAFQGSEAELVIYCTTRSTKRTTFFNDQRRLNVAFSRAKNELIIIASSNYILQYKPGNPIRKVYDYICNFKEYDCVRYPQSLQLVIPKDTHNSVELVPLDCIICELGCSDEAIERELQYYSEYGYFSKLPKVIKCKDKYVLNSDSHIYYAAIELAVDDLAIELQFDKRKQSSAKNMVLNTK